MMLERTLVVGLLAALSCHVLAIDSFNANLEPKALDVILSTGAGVYREGGRLVIATPNDPVVFEDTEGAQYSLVGSIQHSMKRTDFIVFQGHSEVHSYWIVNSLTGRKVRVQGMPRLSPDGKRYLISSMDLEAGSVDNLLQIIRTGDFSTEFEKHYPQDDGVGPSDATWIDNARIAFIERGMQRVPARLLLLELKDGKWIGPHEGK